MPTVVLRPQVAPKHSVTSPANEFTWGTYGAAPQWADDDDTSGAYIVVPSANTTRWLTAPLPALSIPSGATVTGITGWFRATASSHGHLVGFALRANDSTSTTAIVYLKRASSPSLSFTEVSGGPDTYIVDQPLTAVDWTAIATGYLIPGTAWLGLLETGPGRLDVLEAALVIGYEGGTSPRARRRLTQTDHGIGHGVPRLTQRRSVQSSNRIAGGTV